MSFSLLKLLFLRKASNKQLKLSQVEYEKAPQTKKLNGWKQRTGNYLEYP